MAQTYSFFCLLFIYWSICSGISHSSSYSSYDGPLYDSSAYTECKQHPEEPLYNGGILENQEPEYIWVKGQSGTIVYSPAFRLQNLTQATFYCFSTWVKINDTGLVLITASLLTETAKQNCTGTVLAKCGCWSFLKGGFVLNSPSTSSMLYLQTSVGKDINIEIANPSLQPFNKEQWRLNQEYKINKVRKRAVIIHVSINNGVKLEGAEITINQASKDFPFGSAIAKTIIGNLPYQSWFTERFNAAVFENELKWYATEPKQGQLNYTLADQMLEFIRANQIIARGHNIFWEDPKYTPQWVLNLTASQLESAVNSRIKSLMMKYKEEFIHWDVSNEMLHFDFYEQRLGPNASLNFFETAQASDPLAKLFMNDFNVVETCDDVNSTVDNFISRLREFKRGGVRMEGIGLEGHFTVPNLPLMRAILDKLATLGLPIWLTEVDISKTLSKETQGVYLEEVLREGFSHPSVKGIMLWTALHPNGCYQMCLTDNNFDNLPAGDVVDKLLKEWKTGMLKGESDEQGSFSFQGFLGEYNVTARYGDKTVSSTFSLSQGDETRHFSIQL